MVSLVMGCKKDPFNPDSGITDSGIEGLLKKPYLPELERLYNQLQIPNFGNIKLVNGDILKFENAEHYDQVYESLNELYEAWTVLFMETYYTGDEDELDATIERLGFDENLPLFKFVERYKVAHPLIWEAVEQEEQWLERGGGGRSPSDPITQCPIEQTLLSNYYEYCIGDTISQLRPDGWEIHIPTSKLQYLTQIRNSSIQELISRAEVPGGGGGPIYTGEPFNAIIFPPEDQTCYKSGHEINPTQLHGDNYKFEWSYHFRYKKFGQKVVATATIKNYKYKNSKWKKDYGSSCKVEFSAQLYFEGTYCDDIGQVGGTQKYELYLHSRSVSYPIHSWIWYTPSKIRNDTESSYVECRHRSTYYKFNAETGAQIN
jgi:hypothetical protein